MSKLRNGTNVKFIDGISLNKIINMSPIRSHIVGLLLMYPELSFTDLSKKMGRSKSTIHPHLKKLEEVGIVYVAREEHRGGNPAKYYSYNRESGRKSPVGKIDKSKGVNEDIAQKIITTEKNKMVVLKGVIEMYIKFWDLLGANLEEAPRIIEKMPSIMADYADTRFFLTKEEYELWWKKYFKLSVEFGKYLGEESIKNPSSEKSFYFFATFLPLKQIYEKTRFKEE
ncbi:MAG: winged helix-turn-helix domain-containing protein [Promethearchaeota archaeon]|jgi:predicted transcriptional regulator